jgi:hypothetical protein
VNWYQTSRKITGTVPRHRHGHDAEIIDAGGGPPLVDDLVDDGFKHITVMDISPTAIQSAQARMGARARRSSAELTPHESCRHITTM